MIDRLEEVLKGLRPEEENRLLELLRQGGVVRAAAAENVEEPAGQERSADTLHSAAMDFPEPNSAGEGEWAGVQRYAMPEGPGRELAFRAVEDSVAAVRSAHGQEEPALRGQNLGTEESLARFTVSDPAAAAVLMALARRAMGQILPAGKGIGHDSSTLTMEAGQDSGGAVLQSLYRRAAEAVAGVVTARVQNGPVVIREEQAAGSGLTVRALDLAVRRDSRRYDGAMNIY